MDQTISDIAIDRRAVTPLFRQVYAGFSSAILDRRLRPGAKLPASRAMADRLSLSRTVIVAAYEQLLAEGYATGRIGSGTYVTTDLPEGPSPSGLVKPRAPLVPACRGSPVRSTSHCRATTAHSIRPHADRRAYRRRGGD